MKGFLVFVSFLVLVDIRVNAADDSCSSFTTSKFFSKDTAILKFSLPEACTRDASLNLVLVSMKDLSPGSTLDDVCQISSSRWLKEPVSQCMLDVADQEYSVKKRLKDGAAMRRVEMSLTAEFDDHEHVKTTVLLQLPSEQDEDVYPTERSSHGTNEDKPSFAQTAGFGFLMMGLIFAVILTLVAAVLFKTKGTWLPVVRRARDSALLIYDRPRGSHVYDPIIRRGGQQQPPSNPADASRASLGEAHYSVIGDVRGCSGVRASSDVRESSGLYEVPVPMKPAQRASQGESNV